MLLSFQVMTSHSNNFVSSAKLNVLMGIKFSKARGHLMMASFKKCF